MYAAARRLAAPALALLLLFLFLQSGGRPILINQGIDLLFRLRGPLPPDQRIVIVGVDEASLQQYGQWPFSRRLHAELLACLHGARAVGFDFLFPEASGDDAVFSAALAKGPPTVLAVAADGSRGLLNPSPSITGYSAVGHIETMLSGDGIVRQVLLGASHGAPAFAVNLARVGGEGVKVRDREGEASPRTINFFGPEATFLTLSYRDVLEGRYPPHIFQGRYVLVGAQALGLGDSHVTAFTRTSPTPGIEIQANILANLLNADFIRPVDWLPFTLIVVFAVLPLAIWPLAGERRNVLLNLVLGPVVAGGAFLLFQRHVFFDYLSPLIFLLLAYLFYLLQELINAARHILHQARALDQQLDERLQLAYHPHGGAGIVRKRSNNPLLSPAGIQDHLGRLKEAAAALGLQHHFLENLLNRELPPLILWDSGSGEPVFANAAFREFWRAFASGHEGETLPVFDDFAEHIKPRGSEGVVPQIGGKDNLLQLFDLQVRMASGRRYLQGSMHRLLAPGTGFAGYLAAR